MKVLSLFSGVGGFDMGLENAGMKTVFQCEWDKHCRTILDRHWPDVPKWDDVSTLTGEHILAHAPVIDVVAWGSPCQDLSVAGKRAGLEGGRSGLFYEGMRIITELRKASNGKYPRISIWENVYGALNSNKGEDFEAILKEMVEAGSLLCEWRVLDAQYFGVPQRRRRVFVVAVFDSATATRCPDPLLPISEGLLWNPSARTTKRQESSNTASGSIGSGREIANSITAELYHHGSVVNQDANNGHVVIEPFTPSSFAQYEQGVGTLRSNGGDLGGGSETLVVNQDRTYRDVTGALLGRDSFGPNHEGARDGKLVLEPMLLDGTRVDDVRVYESPVQTLKERMGTGGNNVPMVAFSHTQGLDAQPSESAWPTLRKEGNGHAVAYDEYNDALGGNVHHALRAGTKQSTGVVVGTLRSGGDGGVPSSRGEHLVVEPTMVVRRLTPLECERLMGWPDNWTNGQTDTHRYKQCGNGVASPVAQWIGEQLRNL